MKITNRIYKFRITSSFSLLNFVGENIKNFSYTYRPFTVVFWREHKGVALVYKSARLIIHSPQPEIAHQYYNHLIGLGYTLSPIVLVTQSATYQLRGRINYYTLVNELSFSYQPEIFHAVTRYLGKIHLTLFHSGKLILTGLKSEGDIEKALDFILQIELCL